MMNSNSKTKHDVTVAINGDIVAVLNSNNITVTVMNLEMNIYHLDTMENIDKFGYGKEKNSPDLL